MEFCGVIKHSCYRLSTKRDQNYCNAFANKGQRGGFGGRKLTDKNYNRQSNNSFTSFLAPRKFEMAAAKMLFDILPYVYIFFAFTTLPMPTAFEVITK